LSRCDPGLFGLYEFRKNVFSGNKSAVLFQGPIGPYKLSESLFAANEHLYGSGMGPAVNFKPLADSVLELPSSSKVINQPVAIEMDQSKRGYLHVVAGTAAAEVGAGLFTRHP
jgi:hypothetical protein